MLTPSGVTAAEYTEAILNGNPQHVELVAIGQTYGNNQPIVFTEDDIEVSGGLSLSSYFNGDTDLTMGRAVMDELVISLFRSEKTAAITWSGEYQLKLGVEIETEVQGETVMATDWVTVGYYIGKNPERSVTDDVIELHAVDRMSLLDRPAQDYIQTLTIDQTHTISVRDLYEGICDWCGVNTVAGDELSDIMDREYAALPFDASGYTCREVIALIAEANCCYARINAAGKMVLCWYQDCMDDYWVHRANEYTIAVTELDLISNASLKKTWGDLDDGITTWGGLKSYLWGELQGWEVPFRVHALNVRLVAEDAGIYRPANVNADRNIYMIVDNPFLKTANNTEVEDYIDPIADRLIDFGVYIPMSVECVGNWLVEPGDVISVEVGRGTQTRCPIFVRQLRWNGVCRDRYECTGNLQRETVNPYVNKKLVEGGRMHIIRQTVDESYERIQDELGNYSTKQQTAEQIQLYVSTKADIIYATTAPTWLNRPANAYDPVSGTYAVGDYCLQTISGVTKSYRCTTAITTPEAWDGTKWAVDTLPVAVGTIWVNTSPYLQTEADAYDSNETYNSGDLSTHDGSVYQCNTDNTTGTWDSSKWDLYESPVPKNEWKKYNGSSWDLVSENTVYEKKSGIDITSDGVKIFGNKYVRISAGENESTYWSYSSFGLTYYTGTTTQNFRLGVISNLNVTCFSGVFNYITANPTKNSIMLYSSLYDSSLHQSFLFWEVEDVNSSKRGVLRPGGNDTNYLGDSSHIWKYAYLDEIIGHRTYFTDDVYWYDVYMRPMESENVRIVFRQVYQRTGAYAGNSHIRLLAEGTETFYFFGSVVSSSSRKAKENIAQMKSVGDIIDQLEPVTFAYKKDVSKKNNYGLIYEDVVGVLPEICTEQVSEDDEVGIDYSKLVPLLLKEIQDLRKRVKALEERK